MSRGKNEAAFDTLVASKDAIEQEFGEALRWERLDNRRACRIACYAAGSIEDSAEQQEQYRKWAVDRLLRFKSVFGPRLQNSRRRLPLEHCRWPTCTPRSSAVGQS